VTGELTFTAFWEDEPGPGWQSLFRHHWPHYRIWFLKEGERARASYAESLKMLREHMPELLPVYERLCELAGGGDLEARLLAMWSPPSYLNGCSQAAWTRGEPMLVRNYDYAPDRIEGAILGTGWAGRRVIGVSDFLWGLLDGINDAGLAVSLAHTLTLLDRTGAYVTAYVSPDRGVVFRDVPVATNHQEDVEWHEHASATRSLEREELISRALDDAPDPQGFADGFLRPPVHAVDYAHGMGTLYTAVYKPRRGSVEYRWPGIRWEHSFEHFREGTRTVDLLQTSAA
jgi:predicted choloylglycine hydrolase